MKIISFQLGQMQANCYFLIEGNRCLIVDPADEAPFILEELLRRKLSLLAIVATHGHFDHIMAAGEIQLSFDVPFYIHEEDLFLVKRVNETARYFLGFNPHTIQPKKIKHLSSGKFEVGNLMLDVIFTPGHTPGSVCLYRKEENILFTGDTLFKDGIGRYDFSYSSKIKLKGSLERLFSLPPEIVVYPGHGEKTSIKEEKFDSIITL